jgi:hypothetical protein
VRFYVLLSSILSMLGRMKVVTLRKMRVMGCFLVVASFVMPGGLVMMARSMLMMFGRLRVMIGCFL